MDITFKNVYQPLNAIPVFAGLAPINIGLLPHIPVSWICTYFSASAWSILTTSSFVTGIPPVQCSGANCTSIFLPGGLELARMNDGNGNLNSTLLNGQCTRNSDQQCPWFSTRIFPYPRELRFRDIGLCNLWRATSSRASFVRGFQEFHDLRRQTQKFSMTNIRLECLSDFSSWTPLSMLQRH